MTLKADGRLVHLINHIGSIVVISQNVPFNGVNTYVLNKTPRDCTANHLRC